MSTIWIWVIVGFGVITLLMLIGKSTLKPIKWIGFTLFKVALGGILLFVFNAIGGYYNFTIAINPVTAAFSGLLGIPGLVTLILLKAFIFV